jgi:hypothetical protein
MVAVSKASGMPSVVSVLCKDEQSWRHADQMANFMRSFFMVPSHLASLPLRKAAAYSFFSLARVQAMLLPYKLTI